MFAHCGAGPSWRSRSTGSKVLRIIGWVILGLSAAVAFAVVFALVVQLLWNWIMPAMFGLPPVDFWMAFGILLLAKLLFGGFPHSSPGHGRPKPPPGFGPPEVACGPGEWKHYRQYWKDEGRAAFQEYLERQSREHAAPPEGKPTDQPPKAMDPQEPLDK